SARAGKVEQAARADAPTEGEGIVFGCAEVAGAAVFAAAESAEKSLSAEGWDERAVNRAIPGVPSGKDEGMTFLEFGARLEALAYEGIEECVGFDKGEREKFGSLRD